MVRVQRTKKSKGKLTRMRWGLGLGDMRVVEVHFGASASSCLDGRSHRAGMDALAIRTHWQHRRSHRAGMDALAIRTHWQHGRSHRAGMDPDALAICNDWWRTWQACAFLGAGHRKHCQYRCGRGVAGARLRAVGAQNKKRPFCPPSL